MVSAEQAALGEEHPAARALEAVSVNLAHVPAQFARAFQPVAALVALVRPDVSVRLHVLREVVLALERPRADHAGMRSVVAVADEVSAQVVGEEEVSPTDAARVREFCRGVVSVLDHVLA